MLNHLIAEIATFLETLNDIGTEIEADHQGGEVWFQFRKTKYKIFLSYEDDLDGQ